MLLAALHLVFGIEMTISALRRTPFSNQPRFAFTINMIVTGLLLLILLIAGQTTGTRAQKCSAGLVFMVASLQMNKSTLVILSIVTVLFLVMAAVIAYQLKHTVSIDPGVRISGSRMVYYLLLAAAVQLFLIPFFAMETIQYFTKSVASSNVAEYAIFLSGAFVAILHLFLRANAARMAIKPTDTPWHRRRCFRFFGPNDLEVINISPPLNLVHPNYRADEKRAEPKTQNSFNRLLHKSLPQTPVTLLTYPPKSADLLLKDKNWPPSREQTPITPYYKPDITSPARKSSTASHNRRPSYTLFPGTEEVQLPTTVYSPPGLTRQKSTKRVVSDIQESIPPSPAHITPIIPTILTPDTDKIEPIRTSSLLPPPLPWIQRRPTISQSSATIPIAMRFSTVPSGVFQSRGPSLDIPRLTVPSAAGSRNPSVLIAPFDDQFTNAFQNQVKDAVGRDLNSFRWIDSPAEEEDAGVFSMVLPPTSDGKEGKEKRQMEMRSASPSLYPEEERRKSGWI